MGQTFDRSRQIFDLTVGHWDKRPNKTNKQKTHPKTPKIILFFFSVYVVRYVRNDAV